MAALLVVGCVGVAHNRALAQPRHGISLFGELRYPPDFRHFDWVDPAAPKGGTLRMPGVFTTFDNLHSFIRKGTPAMGLLPMDPYIYERLTMRALDEPSARYGWLAKTIEVSPDRSWVEFVLRPEARFHDGQPVTADDVVFTFDILKAKGPPIVRLTMARLTKAEKRGPLTVRVSLADPADRQLAMVAAEMVVLPRHYWQGREYERTTLEPPLGSGPYRVSAVDPGRSIRFERVKDYWARDLPVNLGRFNFDSIQFEYFQDSDVRLEAVKGNVVDFVVETGAKTWGRGYDFPARSRGHFLKEMVTTESPALGRALVINTRLAKFQDVRVRKALAYAYDREWTIRVLGDGFYQPANSIFQYSELAQRGPPSAAELELLEPFRAELPPELFQGPFSIPPSEGVGRNRDNLRTAAALLREAGYKIKDGTLVNARTGEPFTVDFLLDSPARVRFTLHYASALRQLGIASTMRTVDSSQMMQRRRTLDFEIIYTDRMMGNTPNYELRTYFSSASANSPQTYNWAGIQSPAADRMIGHALQAQSHEAFVTACRALDRVLSFGYYYIDVGVVPGTAYAFWNRFGRPAVSPRFLSGFPHTWWFDSVKDAQIKAGVPIAVPSAGAPSAARGE
jgi:microcin C transport system substrate-binding protein